MCACYQKIDCTRVSHIYAIKKLIARSGTCLPVLPRAITKIPNELIAGRHVV
jgi:hypothetical protein